MNSLIYQVRAAGPHSGHLQCRGRGTAATCQVRVSQVLASDNVPLFIFANILPRGNIAANDHENRALALILHFFMI